MDNPINVRLSNREQHESNSIAGAWLKLPATAEAVSASLTEIGVIGGEQGKDFFITMSECRIPGLTSDMVKAADINELNYLAARMKQLDAHESEKLNALSNTTYQFDSITQLIDYADNHDFFVFLPNITNATELGDYYLHHSEMIQMPEEASQAMMAAA